jgi:hypothetical protein
VICAWHKVLWLWCMFYIRKWHEQNAPPDTSWWHSKGIWKTLCDIGIFAQGLYVIEFPLLCTIHWFMFILNHCAVNGRAKSNFLCSVDLQKNTSPWKPFYVHIFYLYIMWASLWHSVNKFSYSTYPTKSTVSLIRQAIH